jgi:hypothetical protein
MLPKEVTWTSINKRDHLFSMVYACQDNPTIIPNARRFISLAWGTRCEKCDGHLKQHLVATRCMLNLFPGCFKKYSTYTNKEVAGSQPQYHPTDSRKTWVRRWLCLKRSFTDHWDDEVVGKENLVPRLLEQA